MAKPTKGLIDLEAKGTPLDKIPVSISYDIIGLFSGQLYSSPNKAIEELVSNSYDAMAKNCHVLVAPSMEPTEGFVAVWDDGNSMGPTDFVDLWAIARSNKREEEKKAGGALRAQIGRFGIGKLATYVIGRRITFLTKKDGKYHAVMMDYDRLSQAVKGKATTEGEKEVDLDIIRLTEAEAQSVVAPVMKFVKTLENAFKPFGAGAPPSWTFAIVDALKEPAQQLKLGWLRWLVRAALPIVPGFTLYLNGEAIRSRKEETIPKLREWTIGQDDKAAQDLGWEAALDILGRPMVLVPDESGKVYPIRGFFQVYENVLEGGKSEDIARSYGFFIMVRERLINIRDPSFGLRELSYSTFHRFRAVVFADHLDDFLIANRENVRDNPWLPNLHKYFLKKFNEVRLYYEHYAEQEEVNKNLKDKMSRLPASLVRFPLKHATERILKVPGTTGFTIFVPPGEDVRPDGIIEDVVTEDIGYESPIALYHAGERVLKINTEHPVILNHAGRGGAISDALKLMAVAEVMTEAYLHDVGVPPEVVVQAMRMRDRFLREATSRAPVGARYVAYWIRSAFSDRTPSEQAMHQAFRTLGFSVHTMGEGGKPEGLAIASLGVREGLDGKPDLTLGGYRVVYEAKSTEGEVTSAKDANLAGLRDFKIKHHADYAILVAKDFQGARAEGRKPKEEPKEEPKVVREARELEICLMRANDLARLVEASAVRRIALQKLRKLFDRRSPDESAAWVDDLLSVPVKPINLRRALDTVWEMQGDLSESVDLQGIRFYKGGKGGPLSEVDKWELQGWFHALHNLVPELVDADDERVALNAAPDKVIEQALRELSEFPDPSIGDALREALGVSKRPG